MLNINTGLINARNKIQYPVQIFVHRNYLIIAS